MQYKFISLNIWNGGKFIESATKFLVRAQPDILFLQEVYNASEKKLINQLQTINYLKKKLINYEYCFKPLFQDLRNKEGSIDNGLAIFTKYPLIKPQIKYFDVPYGIYNHDKTIDFTNFPAGVLIAHTFIGKTTIKLLNVHGPVNYDGLAHTVRRENLVKLILKNIKTTDAIILGGDFNMQPQTIGIKKIAKNLTPVMNWTKINTSFNLQQKDLQQSPGYSNAVVDMAFVSHSIKINAASFPQVNISDHLPLVVNFELNVVE